MQSQPVAPHHGHEVDPHSGLRTVIQGEEKHHDEKPTVMSKVKDKVNKIKHKMGKKKHDDGMNRGSDTSSDEEEMEVDEAGYKEDDDPKINSAPTSEPQRVSMGDTEKFEPEKVRLGDAIGDVKEVPPAPKSTNPPARASEPQRVSIGDAEKFETEKMQLGDGIGAVKDHPAAPKSTNPPARASEPQRFSIGDAEKSEAEKVRLGDAIGDVEEDAAAPKSTNPPARGGEDIGMTPVIQSFENVSVSNEPKPEIGPKRELDPKPESQPSAPTGSTDQPTVTYTEKLKSMTTAPAGYGKNIASTVYGTLSNAGTAVVQKIRGGPPTKVDTETNRDVSQDKGVSGKGYNIETNRDVSQDKGVSGKGYISEKLKPGEEDQTLSDKISEAVQRSKEKTMGSGVAAQTMAGGTQMVEKIRGAMTSVVGGGSNKEKTMASGNTAQTKAGGTGMVEKMRGAVTSVVGGGDKPPSTVASDLHQEKGSNEEKTMASGNTAQTKAGGTGMVEKMRGAVTSAVGGGDKPPSTTVASDLHQEKGSNEEKTMDSGATSQTKAGGTGMVEKIRGAVTSAVGGGDKSPSTTVASDLNQGKGSNDEKTMDSGATAQTKAGGTGMVEKIRGAVTSVVGGGDKSPNTTVASDLHQEKGSNEAAEPRMQE